MIPTSIDGTDITGATIDGTDVQEITVDGQTVFTAAPQINTPVAYSDLVLWYPYDSATYGGSNADDVTAILGGSGDDTAYDGTPTGVTYQASGGVVDISAGSNSGAFDHDGNEYVEIDTSFNLPQNFTLSLWIDIRQTDGRDDVYFLEGYDVPSQGNRPIFYYSNQNQLRVIDKQGGVGGVQAFATVSLPFNQYIHIAYTYDGQNLRIYYDGNDVGGSSNADIFNFTNDFAIGTGGGFGESQFATMDDIRIYNSALSASQINQIYLNTEP